MKTTTSDKPCGCYDRINEALAPRNTKIAPFYLLDSDQKGMPFGICTVQIEKGRGKAKETAMFASYCPFCGVHLRKTERKK